MCKVKKAYDKGVVKVYLAGHPSVSPVIDALAAAMVKAGAKDRRGQAPQSGMARELQQLVEQLQEIVH